ncbi:MAG: outer membrane protein assembly factor BamE [Pseudomonadota bacterium]
MRQRNVFFLVGKVVLLAALSLEGCSTWNPYRPEVSQGNIVTPEAVARLTVGMSASQVQAILGTPVTRDFLQADRWDYFRYVSKGEKKLTVHMLTVWFEKGQLVRWDGKGFPGVTDSENSASTPSLNTSNSLKAQ